jgi:hypothetical protein
MVDIGLAYQIQPPVTIDPGQPTPIELLVTNHGNVPTKADLTFRVYIGTTAAIEPTDLVVQSTVIPRVKLAPGQSRLINLTIPYPGPSIDFKFINFIVSTSDPLGDANQANNVLIEASPTRFD